MTKRLCLAFLSACLLLAGCGEPREIQFFGLWEGTITDEQREALEIDKDLPGDRAEVEITPDAIIINGKVHIVNYDQNVIDTLAEIVGQNRVITIRPNEDGTARLTAVGLRRNEVIRIQLRRVQ